MPNFNRRLLVVAALGALALAGCSKGAGTVDTADMTLGDPNAKVKMVEYASLTCSHCGTFNNDVFPAPFGPISAVISPPRSATETLSIICRLPR